MSKEINKAIKAANTKEYSGFKSNISDLVSSKMKEKLSGFMGYLEKNMFKDTKKED